jgi:hypothetical protein
MDLNSLIVSCVAAGQALLEIPTSFSESEEDDNIGEEEIILLLTKRRKLQVIVAGYTAKQTKTVLSSKKVLYYCKITKCCWSFVPIKAPKEVPESYITRKCNY